MIEIFRKNIEITAFGVCTYLGDKMGVAASRVRMYFIYISFLTFGSPALLYFIIAFWLNVKRYIQQRSNSVRWH
jgi:phage shock protein PspC (stress-responsive transcriptional regulator)